MKDITDHLDSRSIDHRSAPAVLTISNEDFQHHFKLNAASHEKAPKHLDLGCIEDLYKTSNHTITGKSDQASVTQLSDQSVDVGGALAFAGRWAQAAGHRAASFLTHPEEQAAFIKGQAKDQADFGRGVAVGAINAIGTAAIGAINIQLDPVAAAQHALESVGKITAAVANDPLGSLDHMLTGAKEQALALGRMNRYQVGEVAGAAGVMNMVPGLGELLGPVGGKIATAFEGETALGSLGSAAAKIVEEEIVGGKQIVEAIAKRLHPVEEAKTIGSEIVETGKKGWEEVGKAASAQKELAPVTGIAPEVHEIAEAPMVAPDIDWTPGKAMSMPEFEAWLQKHGSELAILPNKKVREEDIDPGFDLKLPEDGIIYV